MLSRPCSSLKRAATGGAFFSLLAVAATAGLPLAVQQGHRTEASPTLAVGQTGNGTAGTRAHDVRTSLARLNVPDVADGPARSARLRSTAPAERVVAELPETATKPFGLVGVTWQGGFPTDDLTVQIKTRVDDDWSSWQDLEVDTDGPADDAGTRAGTSPTWVGDADGVGVRILSADGTAPDDVQVATIDGGTGLAEPAGGTAELAAATTASAAVTARPRIVTRAQWGVDRSYEVPCDSPRTAPNMRGILLHHTVGSNDYTRADAPGVVRGIHRYHTQIRGWCDTGYNFLVDRFGTVYEGRRGGIENQVRGAHGGNWDVNLYTTGISMMGTFEDVPVPKAMKDAVVKLAAWRLSLFGHGARGWITLDGHRVHRISGHRDIALAGIKPSTATACPGRYGYDWLNGPLRGRVQRLIDAAATPEPSYETARMAGENRYGTAAAIAEATFPGQVDAVFLASGQDFPDALSGGPAAARQAGPVLLARHDRLPAETAAALQRLAPTTIYILGGAGAISDGVVTQARQYTSQVVRLGGSNRYTTATAVSKRFWTSAGVVYVTSGAAFADALSGGALAAHEAAPILLSRNDALPTTVVRDLKRLNPARVVLLGGTGALGDTVRADVARAVPAATVSRLAGSDRYATSAAIAQAGWAASENVYVAAGTSFPDALAGVAAAAHGGGPLLLSRTRCLPAPVFDQMTRLEPQERVLLGGSAVLDESAATTRC